MASFDAIVLADSPHASTKLLGLTLAERGRRVAAKAGARRILVIDSEAAAREVVAWDRERGDAGLLVLRAGDQVVHTPLVTPLVGGARRIAVAADGRYVGAAFASGASATELAAQIATDHRDGDRTVVAAWTDAERVVHGDIAVHPASTRDERRGATRMLLRLLVKKSEDSPVSQYIYRPLSRPLTRLLLRTPITANQVSYAVAVIGLIGCYLTLRPDQQSLIIGAGLVFAAGIIDGCDGEISRLRLTSSQFGAWLDTVVDESTTLIYFVAIGYHTYQHYPHSWVAASIVVGAVSYAISIYVIYYFCIVVLRAGGSQYYVGALDIVEGPNGAGLRARPRAASKFPPWMVRVGTIAMYFVRRDMINMVSFGLTFVNAYEFIYGAMLLGGIVTVVVVVPEHIKLRRQIREVVRRGGSPHLLAS